MKSTYFFAFFIFASATSAQNRGLSNVSNPNQRNINININNVPQTNLSNTTSSMNFALLNNQSQRNNSFANVSNVSRAMPDNAEQNIASSARNVNASRGLVVQNTIRNTAPNVVQSVNVSKPNNFEDNNIVLIQAVKMVEVAVSPSPNDFNVNVIDITPQVQIKAPELTIKLPTPSIEIALKVKEVKEVNNPKKVKFDESSNITLKKVKSKHSTRIPQRGFQYVQHYSKVKIVLAKCSKIFKKKSKIKKTALSVVCCSF